MLPLSQAIGSNTRQRSGPLCHTQGSLAASPNYTVTFTGADLIIVDAETPPLPPQPPTPAPTPGIQTGELAMTVGSSRETNDPLALQARPLLFLTTADAAAPLTAQF